MPRLSGLTYYSRLKTKESLEVRRLRADILLVYNILFGLVHVNSNALFMLRSQPHLRSYKYVMVKQSSVNGLRESSFSNRVVTWLIYERIYQFVQTLQVPVNSVDH